MTRRTGSCSASALFSATIIFLRDYEALERYRYSDRARRDRPADPAAVPGSTPDQRRLPRRQPGPAHLPADGAGEDLHRRLPRQLPERAPRGAGRRARRFMAVIVLPPLKHLGPAAGRLGRGDADAGLHPRPGQLGDVLRRLPGADLRRDRPDLVRDHRAGDVRGRAPGSSPTPPRTSRSASTSGSIRSHDAGRQRLPGRAVDLRPGRRGAVRPRPRRVPRAAPRLSTGDFPDRCAILPAPHTDFIYAVIVDELGLFGGAARAC